MLSHVALGRESQVRGNLDAAVVRVGKEILYEPDLRVDDILLQRHMLAFLKQCREIIRLQADGGRDILNLQIPVEVGIDIVLAAADVRTHILRGGHAVGLQLPDQTCVMHLRPLAGMDRADRSRTFLQRLDVVVAQVESGFRAQAPADGRSGSERDNDDSQIDLLPERIV